MRAWLSIGKQRAYREGDLIEFEIAGEVTPSELLAGLALGTEAQALCGYALFLITVGGPWSFPPQTRQALAAFHRQNRAVGATAVVGASSAMRMLIDLVLRAIGLVVGQAPTTRFFANRVEAMGWLAEQRLLGQQGRLAR